MKLNKWKKGLLVGLVLLLIPVFAVAPSIPILVSPANASTNVPIEFDIKFNISDGDNDNMDVEFYVKNEIVDSTDVENIENARPGINDWIQPPANCHDDDWSTYSYIEVCAYGPCVDYYNYH